MHLPFLLSKPICLTLTAFILLTVDLASYVSFNILSARPALVAARDFKTREYG